MNEVKHDNLLKNLSLFHQYLKKYIVQEKLEKYIKKFPTFSEVYASYRSDSVKDDTSIIVTKTLVHGVEEGLITEYDLDELLFLIFEDSLFNSHLYKLTSSSFDYINSDFAKSLFKSWRIPTEHRILNNINKEISKDFVICGYRVEDNLEGLESVRLLLLDSTPLEFYYKNEGNKDAIFPTIVEIDFRRKLLHIRLKDVDNIADANEKRSTMSGRIANTLNFISSFNPKIQFEEIKNFKSSLYHLEEHLLSQKRDLAYSKLEDFNKEIDIFTDKVSKKFNPPSSNEITPKEYISTGVLSIIATTLSGNDIGDVVGIRFRDTQNEKKYAEITIKDTGNMCISTSNLYWLNLSVLQSTKSVEFLKIIPQLDNGSAIVNLEFSLETANVKLHQRTHLEGTDGIRPSQEKYDDVINYLMQFIK
ncbi:hypothetical protein [Cytobacillus horneckiae]|uniref:Uncharacterized protein n=1 Tax=Cytobacillus horneckiae TaxID=549687 RepID=A0A2N0ZB54_9BACI|nr:hypothetical protein [Cytobacillus horneckiae]MEC1155522.1 hypothetical protein [Cytobacillus horneckiae]MED2936841.1 hypothetical protein [Cytobacillus horneckiae]PKG26738.1 hypothetical protein CWS20_22420 [Cytobacillus horneckiae]